MKKPNEGAIEEIRKLAENPGAFEKEATKLLAYVWELGRSAGISWTTCESTGQTPESWTYNNPFDK